MKKSRSPPDNRFYRTGLLIDSSEIHYSPNSFVFAGTLPLVYYPPVNRTERENF